MHSLQFWKSWHKPHQYFLFVLALMLMLSIWYFWYSYLISPSPVITWEHYQELQTEEIPIRTFPVGLHSIQVKADNFKVFEVLAGSDLQPNLPALQIFLIFFVISIITLIAIITTLSRFWFLIGMGVFSLFAISLQLEALEIFGLTNKLAALGVIVPVVGLAYFFHAFNSSAGFLKRIIFFSLLVILLGITITFISPVADPLLHISVNGYSIGLILTIVFILMIGHEIPAAFINLLTQGTRQTKSMRHFLFISGAYLLNLLISYAIEVGYLDWDIWVIDFFILFTASALLGIWGFRQREVQYESILPANPLGIYLIVALACLSFATLGLFFSTANDTVTGVLHDIILYSHLGYGIIFIFYIISNFGAMLSQNLQVYKVLYKPKTMYYATFRIMGLITCFAFLVFDTSYRTVLDQLYASYYNTYGDLYLGQGNDTVAEAYYNKSVFYRNQNHHAHYALSTIQTARLEPQKVRYELTQAIGGASSPFAYVQLAEAFQQYGSPLTALETLNEGLKKFPENGPLLNELGRTFSRLNLVDSALLSFQQARNYGSTKEIAETNLLATSAKFKLSYPADSLLELLGSEKQGPRANALALANLQNLPIALPFELGEDTIVSASRATFLCNYLINQAHRIDTTLLNDVIALANRPTNDYFKEPILVAVAHVYYAQGWIKRAFDLTREVAYTVGRGKYFSLLGTWALEQHNPAIAANYFYIAKDKNVPDAFYYETVAYTEADSLLLAKPYWDSLSRIDDLSLANLGRNMKVVLNANPDQIMSLSDSNKYQYCRYRIKATDTVTFWRVAGSIQNEELKANAILDISRKLFSMDEPVAAVSILKQVKGLRLTGKKVYEEILVLNMMLIAEIDPEQFSKQPLESALPVEGFRNEVVYLRALQDELANRPEAQEKYQYLSQANLHFEEGLIAAARYFTKDSTDRLRSYSIIVSGLLVRPSSIKLLKEYIKQAALVGFDDEAEESLNKLRGLLSPQAFNRYIEENPDFFSIDE